MYFHRAFPSSTETRFLHLIDPGITLLQRSKFDPPFICGIFFFIIKPRRRCFRVDSIVPIRLYGDVRLHIRREYIFDEQQYVHACRLMAYLTTSEQKFNIRYAAKRFQPKFKYYLMSHICTSNDPLRTFIHLPIHLQSRCYFLHFHFPFLVKFSIFFLFLFFTFSRELSSLCIRNVDIVNLLSQLQHASRVAL